jgi:hypothetical protein
MIRTAIFRGDTARVFFHRSFMAFSPSRITARSLKSGKSYQRRLESQGRVSLFPSLPSNENLDNGYGLR